MLHLTLKGKEDTIAVLYNSLQELPAHRWLKMQQWLIIESSIGGDLSAIDRHHDRLLTFLNAGKTKEATLEMLNLRQAYFMLLQGINPNWRAFACLVASIDGQPCDDLTEEGLDKTLLKLSKYKKASGKLLDQTIEDVKKNWIPNAERPTLSE